MNKEVVLKLTDICKDYRQGNSVVEVLKNVNLEVTRGKTVSIVGASGSGKSTLLHIAGLLDYADSGSVYVHGIPDYQQNNLQYAHNIRLNHMGFVYQYHHLLKDFNAIENVAMPLIIAGRAKEYAFERAEELLDKLGLANKLYNLPGELSGGQQQRVAIARALVNDPKIILADEPTGNLDSATAEEVFELFIDRAKNHNAAVIMVTHNMALARKMESCYKLDLLLNINDN